MKKKITQKSVHLKLDYTAAAWIEKWSFAERRSKNAIINDAVALRVKIRELKSRYSIYGNQAEFGEICGKLNINPNLRERL